MSLHALIPGASRSVAPLFTAPAPLAKPSVKSVVPVSVHSRSDVLLSCLPAAASSGDTYCASTKYRTVVPLDASRSLVLTWRRRSGELVTYAGFAGGYVNAPVCALTCHFGPRPDCV